MNAVPEVQTGPEAAGETQYAARVCLNCRKRKKACDRVLSRCSRCAAGFQKCEYEDNETGPEPSGVKKTRGANKVKSTSPKKVKLPVLRGPPQNVRPPQGYPPVQPQYASELSLSLLGHNDSSANRRPSLSNLPKWPTEPQSLPSPTFRFKSPGPDFLPTMAVPNGAKNEVNMTDASFLTAPVKPEPGSMGASPAFTDDDMYEDTGDLDFVQADRKVWLTRIPKFLFENWNDDGGDDDEPVRIGKVRIEKDQKSSTGYGRVSMRLDETIQRNKDIPKDYVLDVTNTETENMFVFSEKDMPGYKSKTATDFTARSYLYEKTKAENKSREERRKKFEPNSRRGIPKQTALVGAVAVEAVCRPVENDEYFQMMDRRAKEELAKKPKMEEAKDSQEVAELFRQRQKDLGTDFIRGPGATRKKPQDNKNARIAENELLDIVISKFSQYRYWSFKNLKAVIKQPEAYLKQTLEKVARNVKNGDFAGTWTLRVEDTPMNEAALKGAKDEAAPDGMFGFDGGDDDDEFGSGMDEDDNNVEMEDVKM